MAMSAPAVPPSCLCPSLALDFFPFAVDESLFFPPFEPEEVDEENDEDKFRVIG